MDRETAQKIIKLRAMSKELSDYAEHRTQQLSKDLLMASTLEELKMIQGKVAEVRRLITLHDEIAKELEK